MQRRRFVRPLSIASLTLLAVGCYAGVTLAAAKLWECNFCHQQYQGDNPPRFVKCPKDSPVNGTSATDFRLMSDS